MNIKQEIIDSIKIVVENTIRKSCPQIMFGVVVSVGNSKKCTVRINQIDYELSYYGNTAPTVNQKYPVFAPFNKMSLAFIISGGSGGGGEGGTSDYNQLSNRPSINGITLSGNQSASTLGLEPEIDNGTTNQYFRGDKTWQTLNKSSVGLGNVDNVRQYSATNPPPYPVISVNGETGEVVLTASDVGARPNTWTPSKTDVGLGNVANVLQYSANNPPPYPVVSINGKTGNPVLTAADVGALPTGSLTGYATEDYVDEEVDTKVDIAQGSANVGKFLVVGADGNVTLGSLPLYNGEVV